MGSGCAFVTSLGVVTGALATAVGFADSGAATGATGADADARADGAAWAGVGAVAGFTSAILVFGSEA